MSASRESVANQSENIILTNNDLMSFVVAYLEVNDIAKYGRAGKSTQSVIYYLYQNKLMHLQKRQEQDDIDTLTPEEKKEINSIRFPHSSYLIKLSTAYACKPLGMIQDFRNQRDNDDGRNLFRDVCTDPHLAIRNRSFGSFKNRNFMVLNTLVYCCDYDVNFLDSTFNRGLSSVVKRNDFINNQEAQLMARFFASHPKTNTENLCVGFLRAFDCEAIPVRKMKNDVSLEHTEMKETKNDFSLEHIVENKLFNAEFFIYSYSILSCLSYLVRDIHYLQAIQEKKNRIEDCIQLFLQYQPNLNCSKILPPITYLHSKIPFSSIQNENKDASFSLLPKNNDPDPRAVFLICDLNVLKGRLDYARRDQYERLVEHRVNNIAIKTFFTAKRLLQELETKKQSDSTHTVLLPEIPEQKAHEAIKSFIDLLANMVNNPNQNKELFRNQVQQLKLQHPLLGEKLTWLIKPLESLLVYDMDDLATALMVKQYNKAMTIFQELKSSELNDFDKFTLLEGEARKYIRREAYHEDHVKLIKLLFEWGQCYAEDNKYNKGDVVKKIDCLISGLQHMTPNVRVGILDARAQELSQALKEFQLTNFNKVKSTVVFGIFSKYPGCLKENPVKTIFKFAAP